MANTNAFNDDHRDARGERNIVAGRFRAETERMNRENGGQGGHSNAAEELDKSEETKMALVETEVKRRSGRRLKARGFDKDQVLRSSGWYRVRASATQGEPGEGKNGERN